MGLYKRGGTWWMSLTFHGRRIRRATGTTNKRLAEEVLAKVKTSIVEGTWFDVAEEKSRTFGELLDEFVKDRSRRGRKMRFYDPIVSRLRGSFGDLTLDQVTLSRLRDYKDQRRTDGVGPATINRELATVSGAFNLAVRELEWCRSNPATRVRSEKEPPGRTRYLTPEEEEKLFESSPAWLREIVVFAVNTGMRQGEILALRWPSVDLFRRTVTVEQSKNGEKRTIPLNEVALELLKGRAKVRAIRADLVFPNLAGKSAERGNVERSFRLALGKAKIEDFRFHDLRHTFATRLVQAGVDLYSVQRLLGHKTPIMTQRYAHHSTDSLRGAVEALRGRQSVTNQSQSPSAAVV